MQNNGADILKALGIDTSGLLSATIVFKDARSVPVVFCEYALRRGETEKIETVMSRYELIKKDDEECHLI